MTDFALAAGWRTATIEEIAEKVAMGPFGLSIKVEAFMPIIGDYSHGGSVFDLVLYALDLEEILISQLFGLESDSSSHEMLLGQLYATLITKEQKND